MDNRAAIDAGQKPRKLSLVEIGSDGRKTTFTIYKILGMGTTSIVYRASYLSGGVEHFCVLKELYPEDCGLVRAADGTTLIFDPNTDSLSAGKDVYRICRERCMEAYEVQRMLCVTDEAGMNNGDDPPSDDDMMRAVGVSMPIGLYENEEGMFYAVYKFDGGVDLKKYGSEKFKVRENLYDIVSIITQTAKLVHSFHRHGYLVLDIQESNILVTGGEGNRIAVMFDFGSFVTKADLRRFDLHGGCKDDITFIRSPHMYFCPKELYLLDKYLNDGYLFGAQGHVRNILGNRGENTDLYLIAAILYKRLFDRYPDGTVINKKGDWTLPLDAHFSLSDAVRVQLKKIFSKTLLWSDNRDRCGMEEFISDLSELASLCKAYDPEHRRTLEKAGIGTYQTDISRDILAGASRRHHDDLGGENNKFYNLSKLAKKHNCQIRVKDFRDERLLPGEAMEKNDHVFLIGDGGMGKSTAVYDYWTSCLSDRSEHKKICLYLELSRFAVWENEKRENSYQGQPVNIMGNIAVKIIHKYGDLSHCSSLKDFFEDENCHKNITQMKDLFTRNNSRREYVLLVDGYNEMSEERDRTVFKSELELAANDWKNVSIVLTSRAQNEKKERFHEFLDPFYFVGIPDEDVEQTLKTSVQLSSQQVERLKKDNIWTILKTPMFLNIYCSLNDYSKADKIHTRGELLDYYVIQSERVVATNIKSTGMRQDSVHAERRCFITGFSLPFAANYMDRNKMSSLPSVTLNDKIIDGDLLFLRSCAGSDRISVYESLGGSVSDKASLDFDDGEFKKAAKKIHREKESGGVDLTDAAAERMTMKEIFSIDATLRMLKDETGFCCDTSEGKIEFTHQYFRDYFAAKHIQNILNTAQALREAGMTADDQLMFTIDNSLDYTWSDDVCLLFSEIEGDYVNKPGYMKDR